LNENVSENSESGKNLVNENEITNVIPKKFENCILIIYEEFLKLLVFSSQVLLIALNFIGIV